ncbi:MAG: hypothetical protein JEZ11_21730 [Desulfobacterales bacterium]|nr:hypothetical protein [Desulfobacterales bacterium]
MLDAGYWILDAGCWILDAGYWMLDAGYWMLDTGCWMLDAGYWMVKRRLTEDRRSAVGGSAGNRMLDASKLANFRIFEFLNRRNRGYFISRPDTQGSAEKSTF